MNETFDYSYSWAEMAEIADGQNDCHEVTDEAGDHKTKYEPQRWDSALREELNSYEVTDMPEECETRCEDQSSSEQQRQDNDPKEESNRNSCELRESPRYHETRYQSSSEQQTQGNDLRKRLNRNSHGVRESPRFNETRQSSSKQRSRDNDLREGLNQKRLANNRSRKGFSSENDRYRPSSRNMSPLRSPINRDRDMLVVSVDGSNNYRFTNRQRELAQTTFAEDSSSGCFISPLLPRGVEELALNVDNPTSFGSGHTGSRRKLHLPSEKDGDIRSLADTESEEFKTKMARREKDIAYGKNNDSYKKYIETIPVYKRSSNMQEHPRTPNKYRDCSRRSWDSQVRTWKRKVHMWAEAYMKKNNSSAGQPQKSTNSEAAVPSAHKDDSDSCQSLHDVASDGEDEDNIDLTLGTEAEQSEVI